MPGLAFFSPCQPLLLVCMLKPRLQSMPGLAFGLYALLSPGFCPTQALLLVCMPEPRHLAIPGPAFGLYALAQAFVHTSPCFWCERLNTGFCSWQPLLLVCMHYLAPGLFKPALAFGLYALLSPGICPSQALLLVWMPQPKAFAHAPFLWFVCLS